MGAHAGHGRQVCEYGTVHQSCRCFSDAVTWIKCPAPEECNPSGADYAPKHRKDIRNGRREVKIDP
jgi:hypothetical protein